MSSEEVFPSHLFPIRDVNHENVQQAARAAVGWKNKHGHRLIYKRVVNGLFHKVDNTRGHQYFILVIEAMNDDGIPWSYIAKVKHYGFNMKAPWVFSFEDVLEDFNKH